MANEVVITVTTVDRTKPGMDSADRNATALQNKLTRMGTLSGEALLGIGIAAVKMASSFESKMTLLTTQAGVSQDKMQGLQKSVLDLAGQVGFSPNSLAESLFHVASNMESMGATSEQMMGVVKAAAQGAAVGGADLVDVTNALTAAVASGIPGVKDYQQAMGVLNATIGSGDMKTQDLADAFGTGLLASVKGFGLSIKDVGAALAVFGDNNIRGAKAGTALRVAVQSLAAPTKDGKALLQQFGMTADQLSKDMQSGGLLKALQDLKVHMDKAGISATQQGQILTEMFGKKAGVGVAILFDQLGRLQSKYTELNKGAGGFGDAWAKTQQTTAQKLKDLKASFDALMVSLGQKLLPAVKGVTDFLLKHRDAVVAVAAVLAPLLVTLATFSVTMKTISMVTTLWSAATKIAAAAQWLLNVAMDANPIGLIIVAIGALVVAFVYLWNHSEAFRKFWIGLWNEIWKFLKDVGAWFAGPFVNFFVSAWHWIVAAFDDARKFIFTIAKDIIDFWLNMFGMLLHAAASAFGWIPGVGSKLKDAAKEFDKFKNNVNDSLNAIISGKTVTVTVVGKTAGAITQAPSQFFQGLAHGGIVGGAASGKIGGGLTWVGEHGAELVDLPAGAHVFSNPDSQRMASGTGDGGTLKLEIAAASGAGDLERMFSVWFQSMLRSGKIVINPQYVH